MLRSKAAIRYAKAIGEFADERGALTVVVDELRDVVRLAIATPALATLLKAGGGIRERKRLAILEELFKPRLSEWSWRIIAFLEAKKRLPILSDILDELLELRDTIRGVARVVVESSDSIDEETAAIITSQAARLARTPVAPEFRVIPSLLAGFRLRIGDTIYDQSAAGALRRLRRMLHGT